MEIQVLDHNPLYLDQTYRLKFVFSDNYPIGILSHKIDNVLTQGCQADDSTEAPEVTFVKTGSTPIPIHPHIYSNGIICLDLLGPQGWSPVQNVQSICMSLQSMLTGNTKNERPPGDGDFVAHNKQRPRDIAFYYDDPTV